MKVLVTGASGFVGGSLCSHLVEEDFVVVGGVRRLPVKPLPGVGYCVVDGLNSDTNWSQALTGVDAVVHCAARVHVMRESERDSLIAFREVNVKGTVSLIEQACDRGVKRFIYLSSIKVNGESTDDHPFKADDTPAPEDPYSTSKWETEQEIKKIAHGTGLEVVIIRPPLVYGPGVRANFLRLMQMIKWGVPLPLGEIQNRRSLVALDNLVDLIVTCLRHPAAAHQTFLVSDGEDISTTMLIKRIAAALGKQARLLSISEAMLWVVARLLGKAEFAQRLCGSLQVDISKTRDILEWSPPVLMDEALRKTTQHFLNN